MFCPKCQKPSEENAAYCAYCGASLGVTAEDTAAQPPVPPVVIPDPADAPVPAPQPPVYQPQPEHPVIAAVKSVASSTTFLVAVIAFTAAALFSIVSTFTMGNSLSGFMENAMNNLFSEEDMGGWTDEFWSEDEGGDAGFGDEESYDAEYRDYFVDEMYSGLMTGSLIASMLPQLIVSGLTVTALWLLYAAGKNRRHPGMNTTGLSILHVLAIIGLVVLSLVALLLLVIMGIAMLVIPAAMAGVAGAEGTVASIIIGVVLASFTIAFAFVIFYQVKVLLTINKIKRTILSGVPNGKVGLFVAVMCFVSGGSSVLSFLTVLPMGDIALMVAAVAQAVAYIAFGMTLLQYRNRMKELVFVMQTQPAVPYVQAHNYYGVPAPVITDYGVPAPAFTTPPAQESAAPEENADTPQE